MQNNARNRKPLFAAIGVVVVAGLAWLAFGFFGIQSAFIDNEVDEAGPVFDSEVTQEAADVDAEAEVEADESDLETEAETEETVEEVPEPVITTDFTGSFAGLGRYDAAGVASVLGDGSGQRFLRFEDFATDNGPDLNVYLTRGDETDGSDFIDLGDLTGNIGSQNYEIPADVDLTEYDTVVIWCVRFGVGFGSATLTAAS